MVAPGAGRPADRGWLHVVAPHRCRADNHGTCTGGDSWGLLGTDDLDGTTLLALRGTTGDAFSPDGAVLAFTASGLQQRGMPCAAAGPDASPSGLTAGAGTGITVAALCRNEPAAGSATKTLMVSNDGGRTWTVAGTTPLPGQPSGVAAISPATFVVAAVGGSSLLYRSTDGGHAWSRCCPREAGPRLPTWVSPRPPGAR